MTMVETEHARQMLKSGVLLPLEGYTRRSINTGVHRATADMATTKHLKVA